MHVIQQTLVVREWPLKKPGDEMFFGYVVAVGVFPRDWSPDEMFAYADFAYGESYTRYRLPDDDDLLNGLMRYLWSNVEASAASDGIYAKVWVKLTENGYEVNLP